MKKNITLEQLKELNDNQIICILQVTKDEGDNFNKKRVIENFNTFKNHDGFDQNNYFEFTMNYICEFLTIGVLLELINSAPATCLQYKVTEMYLYQEEWCVQLFHDIDMEKQYYNAAELVDTLWEAFRFILGGVKDETNII